MRRLNPLRLPTYTAAEAASSAAPLPTPFLAAETASSAEDSTAPPVTAASKSVVSATSQHTSEFVANPGVPTLEPVCAHAADAMPYPPPPCCTLAHHPTAPNPEASAVRPASANATLRGFFANAPPQQRGAAGQAPVSAPASVLRSRPHRPPAHAPSPGGGRATRDAPSSSAGQIGRQPEPAHADEQSTGAEAEEARLRDSLRSNLLAVLYLPGHYQALISRERPSLLELCHALDCNQVLYVTTTEG